MAARTTKTRGNSTTRSSRNGSGSGRSGASAPAEAARRSGDNDADREYRRYVNREEEDRAGPPDVLLDVPELKVESIHFELDDLDAHVALKAKVLNLVKLNVGLDVHLSRVKLDVKGVEAEIVLKARLDHVAAIVDRLMTSLDRNPELVKGLSRAVSEVGQGAGDAAGEAGEAVQDIGQGAQGALQDVGKGAGKATADIGQGAGGAVGAVGEGAGQAVGDVGQGAGQAAGDLGGLVSGLGQTVGQAGQQVGQLAQGATGALGGGRGGTGGPSGQSDGGQPQQNGNGAGAAKPTAMAKEMARVVVRQIGHAASDEARDLSLAATRKVREIGERREQRRAERHAATPAALRIADELGVDLAHVEGTGSDGRITAKDVRDMQPA